MRYNNSPRRRSYDEVHPFPLPHAQRWRIRVADSRTKSTEQDSVCQIARELKCADETLKYSGGVEDCAWRDDGDRARKAESWLLGRERCLVSFFVVGLGRERESVWGEVFRDKFRRSYRDGSGDGYALRTTILVRVFLWVWRVFPI